jgi:hypothetical protein
MAKSKSKKNATQTPPCPAGSRDIRSMFHPRVQQATPHAATVMSEVVDLIRCFSKPPVPLRQLFVFELKPNCPSFSPRTSSCAHTAFAGVRGVQHVLVAFWAKGKRRVGVDAHTKP